MESGEEQVTRKERAREEYLFDGMYGIDRIRGGESEEEEQEEPQITRITQIDWEKEDLVVCVI
jgi:hypothetical protein